MSGQESLTPDDRLKVLLVEDTLDEALLVRTLLENEIDAEESGDEPRPERTVLAVGALPGDVEAGCGGILLGHQAHGHRVAILVFSAGGRRSAQKTGPRRQVLPRRPWGPNQYGYQAATTTLEFRPTIFVDVAAHMDQKIDLLQKYRSGPEFRPHLQPYLARASAQYWGRFLGYGEVEPLEAIRSEF